MALAGLSHKCYVCAMRDDYPRGMRFRMMIDGTRGMIISTTWHATGRFKYYVMMDGAGLPTEVDPDDILPEDHPWHDKIKEWRAEGLRLGFERIVVGISATGFRVFYCNDPDGYKQLCRTHPRIRMRYYWKL